jgi:chromo domain-containing protein 1
MLNISSFLAHFQGLASRTATAPLLYIEIYAHIIDSTNDIVHLRFFIFSWDMDISYSYDGNEDKILRPYKMAMLRRIHGLQFKKLLPYCDKGQNPYHFYLMFPPEAAESEEFISTWIKTCKPESKIYSSRDAKSWDFFKSSPRIEFGVVLVHEAFTILHQVPGLYSIVNDQKKSISFWWISDSESPYPFYPSRYQAEVQPSRINAVRLFPHGCAFLLTPSFLVAEPQKAYELLNWFLVGQRAKVCLISFSFGMFS